MRVGERSEEVGSVMKVRSTGVSTCTRIGFFGILALIVIVLVGIVFHYSDNTVQAVTLPAPTIPDSSCRVVNGKSFLIVWSAVPDTKVYEYESYSNEAMTKRRVINSRINTTPKRKSTNLAEAAYWWRVRAIDHNSNEGEWSSLCKMTVDNTDPLINTPTFSQQPGGITITGTVTEPHLDTVTMRVDGEDIDSSAIAVTGNSYAATLSSLAAGSHTLVIMVTDKAGNVATASHTFTVADTTAPVITAAAPTGLTEGDSLVITGTATDNYSAAASVDIVLGGTKHGSASVTDGGFSYDFGMLPAGTYTIAAKGVDAAGNEGASVPVVVTIASTSTSTLQPLVVPTQPPQPTPPANNPQQPAPVQQSAGVPRGAAGEIAVADASAEAENTADTSDVASTRGVDGGATNAAQGIQGTNDTRVAGWGIPVWSWLLPLAIGTLAGGFAGWFLAAARRRKNRE